MQTSRLVGGLICVLVVVIGAAFVWGVVVRSYWAVAIPVVIGFLGMLTLGFWIGWTMAVTRIEPPPEATEEGTSKTDSTP